MTSTSAPSRLDALHATPRRIEELAKRIAEADLSGGERTAAIRELLTGVAGASKDAAADEWLARSYPNVHGWLHDHSDRIRAAVAVGRPEALDEMVGAFSAHLRTVPDNAWRDAGLSVQYQREATRLLGVPSDEQLLFPQPGPDGPVLRFVCRDDQLERLIPDPPMFGSWESAVRGRLEQLGVPEAELDVQGMTKAGLFLKGPSAYHLPPKDAALLVDAVALGARAYALHKDQTLEAVKRDPSTNENVLQMPVQAFLGLRGVANAVGTAASDDDIIAQLRVRLTQRGGRADAIKVVDDGRGGVQVRLPTEQARLLLAPVADGDPATALDTAKIAYAPAAEGPDADNAALLVQCSKLAYLPATDIDKYAKAWGFDEVTHVEDAAVDAQAFLAYDKDEHTIIASFRGTSSLEDVLTDADAQAVDASRYGGGRVHRGFARHAASLLPQVSDAIAAMSAGSASPPRIMLTGHSLGGALATLAAGELLAAGVDVRALYTFGQPKTGDDAFVAALHAALEKHGATYARYVNNNDFVPRVPPGFVHGGHGMYIDSLGAMHSADDTSARDDRKNWLASLVSDGVRDHRSAFYVALVRKHRDIVASAFRALV